jgi:hypothetical protein
MLYFYSTMRHIYTNQTTNLLRELNVYQNYLFRMHPSLFCHLQTIYYTDCRSLVVVLSLSKREVMSSSPARASCVKPKTFKIESDCSFAKCTAFRSENHGSFGYDLINGGTVSQ